MLIIISPVFEIAEVAKKDCQATKLLAYEKSANTIKANHLRHK